MRIPDPMVLRKLTPVRVTMTVTALAFDTVSVSSMGTCESEVSVESFSCVAASIAAAAADAAVVVVVGGGGVLGSEAIMYSIEVS